jgi:tRNA nucleotidyltransferase/poly(A) polymerase
VLRALRFAGQFGLTIEEGTWRALVSAVSELSQLSPERIQEEMMKVLSQAQRPSVALGFYAESGVFAELYPELDIGLREDFAPTLRACDAAPRTRPWVRLSLIVALASVAGDDVGDQLGDRRAIDSEESTRDARRNVIESLMERLRFSNADTKRVAAVAASLSPAPPFAESAVLRRWLNRVGPEHFADIARAWLAFARAHEKQEKKLDVVHRINALRTILRENTPLTIADLALDGSDLKKMGLPPGPQFGEILRYLLEEVLDRPEVNNRADLEDLAAQGGFLIDASRD